MNSSNLKPPKRSPALYWVSALPFLFGMVFFCVGVHLVNVERFYIAKGEIGAGTVTGKRIDEKWTNKSGSSSGRRKKSISHIVSYSFTTKAGRNIDSSCSVAYDVYERVSTGTPVEIQYLRDEPETNRIRENPSFVIGAVFSIIGLLVAAFGLAIFSYEWRQRSLAQRLMRDGIPVDATIRSVGPGNLTINGVRQWLIEFTYQDFQGQTHRGNSGHMRPEVAQGWKAGEAAKVLYDKAAPNKYVWIGSQSGANASSNDPFR